MHITSVVIILGLTAWFLHARGTDALASRAVAEGLCADVNMVTAEELDEITTLLVDYGQFSSPFLLRYRLGLQSLF